MGRVEEILKKYGPMLSGELASILEKKYGINNDAARKAISRASVPVRKLKTIPFNKNQVFCYLEAQFNSAKYRSSLYNALKNESMGVSIVLTALENHDYIMKKTMLPIYSKSPVDNIRGHKKIDELVNILLEHHILMEIDDYYVISQRYRKRDYNITYSKSKEQIAEIVVNDFVRWAGKLNLVAYGSYKVFPEPAYFSHFKWFATIPSYISPLYDSIKKRPGFVVVDVLLKPEASVSDVAFFVEKINIIRNYKGLPAFAPVLLVHGVDEKALKYLKDNKVIVGVLSNLFDKKYSEILMGIYNVLRNATAVIRKEPQKLEKIIKEITKSEGRFNNAMGDLFECMVGLYYGRMGCRYLEMNKLVPAEVDKKYEMDLLVDRNNEISVIECKAIRGRLSVDYVELWINTRIPVFREFLESIYPGRRIVFSLWSLGGFDQDAERLLITHQKSVKKYKLSFYDKKGIYDLAKSTNDTVFCKQLKEHFKEYGEYLELEELEIV